MKNILIITLGVLALSFLAIRVNAQTLKAANVDFFCVGSADSCPIWSEDPYSPGASPINTISSVTMPSTKDPKWTIVYSTGTTLVTTGPVTLMYGPKQKGSAADTE